MRIQDQEELSKVSGLYNWGIMDSGRINLRFQVSTMKIGLDGSGKKKRIREYPKEVEENL